jgi:hypothetical protein
MRHRLLMRMALSRTCLGARPLPPGGRLRLSYHLRGIAMNHLIETGSRARPWNKGKLVGQKAPLRLKDIRAIRIRLQLGDWAAAFGNSLAG